MRMMARVKVTMAIISTVLKMQKLKLKYMKKIQINPVTTISKISF